MAGADDSDVSERGDDFGADLEWLRDRCVELVERAILQQDISLYKSWPARLTPKSTCEEPSEPLKKIFGAMPVSGSKTYDSVSPDALRIFPPKPMTDEPPAADPEKPTAGAE